VAHDVGVFVPLEVAAVGADHPFLIRVQVLRALAAGVLVGHVAQRPLGHVHHLEGVAVEFEGVALLGVPVAAVNLAHPAGCDGIERSLVRE